MPFIYTDFFLFLRRFLTNKLKFVDSEVFIPASYHLQYIKLELVMVAATEMSVCMQEFSVFFTYFFCIFYLFFAYP